MLTSRSDKFHISTIADAAMGYEALQVKEELEWLISIAVGLPSNALGVELGVCNGGTFYALQQVFDKIIGIDVGEKELPFPLRPLDKYIIGNTKDQGIINSINSINLLLIDADHSYEGVKGDYELWKDRVLAGGVIVFHDINGAVGEDGVKKFWQEVKVGEDTDEIILSDKYFGIGVIYV